MNRKLAAGLCAGLAAALFAVWFILDRNVQRLDAALVRRLDRVERLEGLVNDAATRIDEGYRRMDEARIRRESAVRQIVDAELVVNHAAQERAQAESLAQEAQSREQAAREQAAEANRREQSERRQREEQWSRLGRALDKVAATRRQDGKVVADFRLGFIDDKERISRLAGILLAHHGYRATIQGASSEAAATYLREAGIPGDILTLGERSGPLRLTIEDQILGRP